MTIPYVRSPSIHGGTVAFVAQDELWTVPAEGGRARRITDGAAAGLARLSPDGTRLAYTGSAHHVMPEVHVLDLGTGASRQLTWQGSPVAALGWSADGERVVYASYAESVREPQLWEVPADGGAPRMRPERSGLAAGGAGTGGPAFIQRGWVDPAFWKRYRGGTAGAIWWDADGTGEYRRVLTELGGNVTSPALALGRLFFLSDHEGVGNVYSCDLDLADLRRHTDHADFYARGLAGDGTRLVYHAGGALYAIESAERDASPRHVEVEVETPHRVGEYAYVPAAEYAHSAALSPDGSRIAVAARGKAFSFGVHSGPVVQHGDPDLTRYRDPRFLDAERIIALAAGTGPDETFAILDTATGTEERLALDLGSVTEYAVSPDGRSVAVANQRNELLHVDLAEGAVRVLDRSPHGACLDPVFSPDGAWIAYRHPEEGTEPEGEGRAAVRLCHVDSGVAATAAERVLHDMRPAFDPGGEYLYFIGYRDFEPAYDATHLEIGFAKGSRPYAVALRPGLGSPFAEGAAGAGGGPVVLDGIGHRIHRFDVPDGRYKRVLPLACGRFLLLSGVAGGELDRRRRAGRVTDTLSRFDPATGELTVIAEDVADVWLSADRSTMLYRSGDRWRVLPAGVAPGGDEGRLDLGRVKLRVRPADEWRQIFREAWQAMRDHFWDPELSGVDWDGAYARYEPLLSTVATRRELSDLVMEMQGELGTSHAYHEAVPRPVGDVRVPAHLGASLVFDDAARVWRVTRLVDGDRWNPAATSPLHAAGIVDGDAILAVNGTPVSVHGGPAELLVNQAGEEVALTVRTGGDAPRTATVVPLADELRGRYRDWVKANTRRVHEDTDGRVGYVHVPGLMPGGYADFMRAYLAEYGREALIVDVRNNSGGHLSPLVLEKLSRIRVGETHWRTGRTQPYPIESPRGPMVGVINEFCGSDGDIIAQGFKLMGLGHLVGARTWGGVVGSTHKQHFADGTSSTNPAMALSVDELGWGLEGHGVEPDVPVPITPQDHAAGRDPQLGTAIALALESLEKHPAYVHDVRPKPYRGVPPLPPRP